jgi:cytochrome c553
MKFWVLPLLLAGLLPGASAAESSRRELAAILAATPDVQRGQELFRNCVSCHGTDGSGDIAGSVPRIAGQHRSILVRQLLDFRRGKRWDFRMEGITASHNAIPERQDIADVTAYIAGLDWSGPRGMGDGLFVEQGQASFGANCASCHGAAGEGNEAHGVPRLGGQHAAYLSRQIYDAVDGRRPLLTRSHKRDFEKLAFEDVRGIADYLSRVGAQPREGTGSPVGAGRE